MQQNEFNHNSGRSSNSSYASDDESLDDVPLFLGSTEPQRTSISFNKPMGFNLGLGSLASATQQGFQQENGLKLSKAKAPGLNLPLNAGKIDAGDYVEPVANTVTPKSAVSTPEPPTEPLPSSRTARSASLRLQQSPSGNMSQSLHNSELMTEHSGATPARESSATPKPVMRLKPPLLMLPGNNSQSVEPSPQLLSHRLMEPQEQGSSASSLSLALSNSKQYRQQQRSYTSRMQEVEPASIQQGQPFQTVQVSILAPAFSMKHPLTSNSQRPTSRLSTAAAQSHSRDASGSGSLDDDSQGSPDASSDTLEASATHSTADLSANHTLFKTIAAQCSQSLGVGADEMNLLQVQPASPGGAAANTLHVAVQINNSSFTLGALEDMLSANSNLMKMQVNNSASIMSLQEELRSLRQKLETMTTQKQQLEIKTAVQEEKIATLARDNEELSSSNTLLKSKMKDCDAHRAKLMGTISQLKTQFGSIYTANAQQGQGVGAPGLQASQ